jgi:MFS family permease
MFSLITLYLAPIIGFPWTMRIIAFISLACCTVACLTLQTRPITNPTTPKTASTILKHTLPTTLLHAIDLRPLTHDPAYLTTTLATTLIEFAVFLPITYLPSAAITSGLPPRTAYLLIVYLNAASVPGRALPNYLSDTLGRFNTMLTTALACTLLIFTLWLPPTVLEVKSEAALTSFAVLFGFWSGAAISLTPVCIAQVSPVEQVGRRVGTTFSWRRLCLVGGICWGVLWFGVGDVGGGEEGCWAEEVLGGVLMGWMD